MTQASFASWDEFLEAQGLEFRLKLIELAGVLGDGFVSFVLAAPRSEVMGSVPSEDQRAVVDELMAVHLEQKQNPDLHSRSLAMLDALCGYRPERGHSRATSWHLRCGGAVPQISGASLEALLATIVVDVVSAALFNPRLLIYDIVSNHPSYEALVERVRSDEALTAMFYRALEDVEGDKPAAPNVFAVQVMLQTTASSVSGSLLLKDLVMNLLAQIRLHDFDWKGILPAAGDAVVENLNVARKLSQGLEATVPMFVGLLGVDLSVEQGPLDCGGVRIRRSNPFDAKCLNTCSDVETRKYVTTLPDGADTALSGLGIDAQRATVAGYAERKGLTIVSEYCDEGVSAKSLKGRPAALAALEAVRTGEAAGLLVAKMDRLSRSVVDGAGLMERARQEDWTLHFADLDIDTSTPAGEMAANIIVSGSQYERRLISQRTRDALAAKRARGDRLGARPALAEILTRRIVRERKEGRTFQAIANSLMAENILTSRGKRHWYPATIRAVVNSDNAAGLR